MEPLHYCSLNLLDLGGGLVLFPNNYVLMMIFGFALKHELNISLHGVACAERLSLYITMWRLVTTGADADAKRPHPPGYHRTLWTAESWQRKAKKQRKSLGEDWESGHQWGLMGDLRRLRNSKVLWKDFFIDLILYLDCSSGINKDRTFIFVIISKDSGL